MMPPATRPAPPHVPLARAVAVAAAIVAAWLAYDAASFRSLARFMAVIDHCPETFCDFATYYLPMSRHLFDGTGPIHFYLYPPFLAILVLPLAPLPDPVALVAWGVFKAALIPLLIALPFTLVRRVGLGLMALAVGVAAASFPILHDFKWGQISVPITVCVFGGFALWQRGRRVPAALLLALATGLKFYPAWFAIPLLLRRDGRALAWYLGFCALFLAALPALLMGPGATWRFYLGVASQLRGAMEMALDPNSQSLDGVFGRLFYSVDSPWKPTFGLITPVRVIVLALSAAAVFVSLRRPGERGSLALMTLFATLPFITPSSWPHYFVFLPGAFLVLVTEAPARGPARGVVLACAAAAAILASLPCWQAFGSWIQYSGWGVLFWADALTLVGLWLAVASGARAAPAGRSRAAV